MWLNRIGASSNVHSLKITSSVLKEEHRRFLYSKSKIRVWQKLVNTDPTEKNPSWEADSRSPVQWIISILYSWSIQYRVHNSLQLEANLSQKNPVHHILTIVSLRYIIVLSFHLRLGLPIRVVSSFRFTDGSHVRTSPRHMQLISLIWSS